MSYFEKSHILSNYIKLPKGIEFTMHPERQEKLATCERNASIFYDIGNYVGRTFPYSELCKKLTALLKGALSGPRQFLTTESPLKMMKNTLIL